MFERITFDPQIMGGRACIRGMRIPVSIIVSKITHGATYEEVLKDYPDLERDDIQQAMDFAARLSRKGDALVDELLATNPPLQALVAKSKAGRRRPFRLEDNKN